MQQLNDEERRLLCWRLRSERSTVEEQEEAANEIERLSENQKEEEYGPPLTEAEQLVNILRHAEPMYVGLNVRRQAADEIERLAKENDQLANHCEHLRADVIRLAAEAKRLSAEVKKLKDELDLVRQDEERFIYD